MVHSKYAGGHAAITMLRTDSREAQARAAPAGAGLACLPCYIGDDTVGLVRVKAPVAVPEREIWMGIHADSRATPRVQAAARLLASGASLPASLRRHRRRGESDARYLDWEFGLVEQLRRDGTHGFFVV
jgi:DNA-binding transcriptional LysR family regulator